jgi:hypothetical protein
MTPMNDTPPADNSWTSGALRADLARHTQFMVIQGTKRIPCGCKVPHCEKCGDHWPCDAARALAALDEAENWLMMTRNETTGARLLADEYHARADTLAAENAALVEALREAGDVLLNLWTDGPISDMLPDFAASAVLHAADHAKEALSDLAPASDAWLAAHDRAVVERERERLRPYLAISPDHIGRAERYERGEMLPGETGDVAATDRLLLIRTLQRAFAETYAPPLTKED